MPLEVIEVAYIATESFRPVALLVRMMLYILLFESYGYSTYSRSCSRAATDYLLLEGRRELDIVEKVK